MSSKEGSEADVLRIIGIARGICHALNKVLISRDLKKTTKMEVFETLVLSSFFFIQFRNMKHDCGVKPENKGFRNGMSGVTKGDILRNTVSGEIKLEL